MLIQNPVKDNSQNFVNSVTQHLFSLHSLWQVFVPYVYISRLLEYNLSPFENLLYIFFYNVVYVIPLIIIVSIFVFTLGKKKLTEWHGQILKFFSGIMLVSFGLLFLFNYQLLENPVTPVILLIASILLTLIISKIWKKYKKIEM